MTNGHELWRRTTKDNKANDHPDPDWERIKWTANPKKHSYFKWTANLTYEVNGHELFGWTAKTSVVNGQTSMKGQFAVKNHKLVCENVPE